jgi:hypothetical protein
VLDRKRIIPIDLSPVVSNRDFPNSEARHAIILEWFLRNLERGEPPDISRWPNEYNRAFEEFSPGVPPIPIPSPRLLQIARQLPEPRPLDTPILTKLREDWTAERNAYPGWVIAPFENRETIWRFTKRWLLQILTKIETLPAPEDLFLWYELNWRLEVVMMPLFLDWVEKLAAVVEKYHPLLTGRPANNTSISPDKAQFADLPWGQIRDYWVSLVFALAREAREDQAADRFTKWIDLIQPVILQSSEWEAHWHHERCMFALFRLDKEQLSSCLQQWPSKPELPMWEARRAAILAEMGTLAEAEQIAETALAKVRSRLQPFRVDYQTLSQEGWIMSLLNAIKTAIDFVRGRSQSQQYLDRWKRLEVHGGNPWAEFQMLELAVGAVPPTDPPLIEVRSTFEPNWQTTIRHWRSEPAFFDRLPAFALLRLYEQGGVPMRVGSLTNYCEAARKAADWIDIHAPLWALSTRIRAGGLDDLKDKFTRASIAGLSVDQAQNLYAIIKPSLTRSLAERWRDWREAKGSLGYRLIEPLVELLSRLCFRLDDTQKNDVFELALQMYRLPLVQSDLTLGAALGQLFARVIQALPDAILVANLNDLLNLPIPGEGGFSVFDVTRWPEPMGFIEARRHLDGLSVLDRASWDSVIGNLIRIVRDGTKDSRSRAIKRLEALRDMSLLTQEETEAFTRHIWGKLDEQTHLPVETGFTDFSVIFLPEPQRGLAKQRLAEALLARNVPNLATKEGTGLKFTHPLGSEADSYFEAVIESTLPLLALAEYADLYIDWSTEQASELLGKLDKWWDTENYLLADKSLDYEFKAQVEQRFQKMNDALGRAVLPRISVDKDPTGALLAKEVLQKIRDGGVDITRILPATLFISPADLHQVVAELEKSLASHVEQKAKYAIFALQSWVCFSLTRNLVAPPPLLFDLLVQKVFHRSKPALVSAVAGLAEITRHAPNSLSAEQVELLLLSLEYLIPETSPILGTDQDVLKGELKPEIPLEDRPAHRAVSAKLAAGLSHLFAKNGKALPNILLEWEQICRSDPLPEVRRVSREFASG